MAVLLSDMNFSKSPTCICKNDMKDFLVRFQRYAPISFFAYKSINANQGNLVLTVRPDFTELCIREQFYKLAFSDQPINYKDAFHLVDFLPENQLALAIREKLAIWHGLIIVRRSQSAVEFFYFFGEMNEPGINSYYLNYRPLFDSFATQFKKEYQKRLDTLQDQSLLYPVHTDKFLIDSGAQDYYSIFDPLQEYGLTDRERDCVKEMQKGLTNKAIASELNISTRTVESHLHNLYRKCCCHSKTALLKKLCMHV